jgi:hypothetical protein
VIDDLLDGVSFATPMDAQILRLRLERALAAAQQRAERVASAARRFLDLSSDCDYIDGEPDVCPGIAQAGGPCHWCALRHALAAYDALEDDDAT